MIASLGGISAIYLSESPAIVLSVGVAMILWMILSLVLLQGNAVRCVRNPRRIKPFQGG